MLLTFPCSIREFSPHSDLSSRGRSSGRGTPIVLVLHQEIPYRRTRLITYKITDRTMLTTIDVPSGK